MKKKGRVCPLLSTMEICFSRELDLLGSEDSVSEWILSKKGKNGK